MVNTATSDNGFRQSEYTTTQPKNGTKINGAPSQEEQQKRVAEIFQEYQELGLVPIPIEWDLVENGPVYHLQGWDAATPENNPFKPKKSHNGLMIRTWCCYACFDIDLKNTPRKSLFDEQYEIILHQRPEIAAKIYIEQTRNKGYHIWFYYPKLKKKIALASSEQGAEVIAIYACGPLVYTYPTPGYSIIKNSMYDVAELTDDEYDYLISLCQYFNEYKPDYDPQNKAVDYPEEWKQLLKYFDENLPDEAWNQILLEAGLEPYTGFKYQTKHKFTAYKRTGSTGDYIGAKVYFQRKRVMIFSASMHDFPNWHNRQDYPVWSLPPSFVLYYKNKRNWNDTIEEIKRIMDSIGMGSDIEQVEIKRCQFIYLNPKEKVAINKVNLLNFLHDEGGFGLYYYNKKTKDFKLVRNLKNIVEETTAEQIKKFVIGYLSSPDLSFDAEITSAQACEAIINQGPTLFCDSSLEYLPAKQLNFLRDTKETAFIPFINGVVAVTKDGADLIPYSEIKQPIWKSQIKPFEINNDLYADLKRCEFYDFLEKINNNDADRVRSCLTILGFLLHAYKDPSKAYAAILAEETDDDKEGGGTGKGLLIKALSFLLNIVTIDAKNFKHDKSFNYQRVNQDTNLIVFEDCYKNMDFERFNSLITEGLTVEKKNKPEFFLDYNESPKFAFTTNYTLDIRGNHGKRRSIIFEFSPFFGPAHTPADEYGHLFFIDWNKEQWNRFYNLMMFCIQQYLIQGLAPVFSSKKLQNKQIKNKWSEEFYEYFDEIIKERDTVRETKKEYEKFIEVSGFPCKVYPLQKFRQALQFSAEPYKMRTILETNRKLGNRSTFRFEKL